MQKIIVEFEAPMEGGNYYEDKWICFFENNDMGGIVESGLTKEEAFKQLMITLEIKIRYDNNLKFPID